MRDRRRKASRGVIVFSSFLILLGTFNFLYTIISFFQLQLELQFKDHMSTLFTQFPNFTINLTAFWLSTLISLLIMLCWIIAGIGTLLLKEWARQLLLISIGIYFLNKVIDIFINIAIVNEYATQIPVIALCIGILFVLSLSVSVTYFFTHPSVIKQFEKIKKQSR
ncbi:MAG: hypothetical protein PHS93_05305 [Candidatus Omnitrophica bacterium]|nr:hypothetical protein [Candidatus Omnitrophota bacterium]MDD5352567.1 hypothetical protein [Candidatus Omnitrophota bacterium]MDD5550165.1 hypothetical protein [Candidatus Omnitrophota bacterium]